MSNILSGLNKAQQLSVTSNSKKIMVLAGAGSGKTTILTRRIARLLEDKKCTPEQMMVLTFTNKAAKEMIDRAKKICGEHNNLDSMFIGTFHSICNRILRNNVDLTDLSKNFVIMDASDQKSFIKKIVDKMLENKVLFLQEEEKKGIEKEIAQFINKSKELGLRGENATPLLESKEFEDVTYDIISIFKVYESERVKANLADFTDLILYVIELFEKHKEIKNYYTNKLKYVLVDEFQDTNEIQYHFINYFKNNNIFVVGDDDQLIYGWRGASIDTIINMPNSWENLEVIKLENNYRSTGNIIKAANSIISNNESRFDKSLISNKKEGDIIDFFVCANPDFEAEAVAKEILKINEQGVPFKDICILYRTNAISRGFEKVFNKYNIKYHLIGGVGFWARREIKDIMSYLMLGLNYKNNIAFERTINLPTRGIGKKTLEKVYSKAYKENISFMESLADFVKKGELLKGAKLEKAKEYISIYKTINKLIKENIDIEKIIKFIINKTDIINLEYSKEKNEEILNERLFNLKELETVAGSFKTEEALDFSDIEAFCSYASLQASADKDHNEDGVKLMTIHMSKGLEFPYVFIAGMEDGVLPLKRGGSFIGKKQYEEERRLGYVACTRAMEKLYLTMSSSRFGNGFYQSPFVDEIPKEIIRKRDFREEFFGNQNLGKKNSKFVDSDDELERIKALIKEKEGLI